MNVNLNKNMSKKLVTVPESIGVEEALMIMKSHHFRHLPVVNAKNKIVGFVSDRDLYRNLTSDEIEVRQIMVKNVYKFDVKTSMKAVVAAMIREKFSAFLITDDDEIIGIITSEDLLQVLAQLLDGQNAEKSLLGNFLESAMAAASVVRDPNLIT